CRKRLVTNKLITWAEAEACKGDDNKVRLLATDMADILIADDHKFIREMVRITLSTQGWSIDESETARGTLDQVRSTRPKVLLLDVMFEGEGDGLTGFDVCRETSKPVRPSPSPS